MITKSTLDVLLEDNFLTRPDYDLLLARLEPQDWKAWLSVRLLVLAGAFLLCAVMFFFAYNWAEMGKILRLSLPLIGLLACGVGAYSKGLESTLGQVFAFGAVVLVGVFMAVFGQTYQTGAFVYELFLNWALLMIPLALLARNKWLWLMGLYIFAAFLASYCFSLGAQMQIVGFLSLVSAGVLGWCATEFLPASGVSGSGFKAFIWVPLFAFLFFFACADILGFWRTLFPYMWSAVILFSLFGAYAFWRGRDVALVGASVLGLVTLLAVYWVRTGLDNFFLASITLAVLYSAAGYGVYVAARYMKGDK